MPPAFKRDKELGKLGGYYEVSPGMGLYVDPKTQVVSTYP
jgi:hypothetical protein